MNHWSVSAEKCSWLLRMSLQWSVLRLWLFLDCKIVWPISVLLLVKKLTDFNTVKKSHVLISYDLPLKIWWTWVIPLVSTHRQQYITMEWNCRNNRLFRPFFFDSKSEQEKCNSKTGIVNCKRLYLSYYSCDICWLNRYFAIYYGWSLMYSDPLYSSPIRDHIWRIADP